VKFGKYVFCAVLTFGLAAWMGTPAMGHNVFKKQLSENFPEMKISCNACHVKGEEKSTRNAFGSLIHKELKDLELTKNYEAIKDRDEKKKYEAEVMTPAFQKAYKKISAMSFADFVKAGGLEGVEVDDDN
jgi:phosphatidate phosphatase APP1